MHGLHGVIATGRQATRVAGHGLGDNRTGTAGVAVGCGYGGCVGAGALAVGEASAVVAPALLCPSHRDRGHQAHIPSPSRLVTAVSLASPSPRTCFTKPRNCIAVPIPRAQLPESLVGAGQGHHA